MSRLSVIFQPSGRGVQGLKSNLGVATPRDILARLREIIDMTTDLMDARANGGENRR